MQPLVSPRQPEMDESYVDRPGRLSMFMLSTIVTNNTLIQVYWQDWRRDLPRDDVEARSEAYL